MSTAVPHRKVGRPSVISLFSGALGLDLGLEQAGFDIRVAVECNRFAAETIRRNRPQIAVIERKLEVVSTPEILKAAGLKRGEVTVVTGGPSCQAFSTAGQRGSFGDPRGVMFREFLRVVREVRPRFFVMENVRGVLSSAIRHRPLKERGPGFARLKPEEELGSAFSLILEELKRLNYHTVFDLLNAADFGVPQVRHRVIFIGSRDGEPIEMPKRTHAQRPGPLELSWLSLRDGIHRLDDQKPTYIELTPKSRRYLKRVPEGGNWRDLPKRQQVEAMGKAFVSWGGRAGFFRRLAWDRPAPALTTRPNCKATMLCHPEELRPLTVLEYARLQQFPESWEFFGGPPQQYIQAGNAVPIGLGRSIGQSIRKAMRSRRKAAARPGILCADSTLLSRLAKRPRTILNPIRMRKIKDPQAGIVWRNGRERSRRDMLVILDNGKGRDYARSFEVRP